MFPVSRRQWLRAVLAVRNAQPARTYATPFAPMPDTSDSSSSPLVGSSAEQPSAQDAASGASAAPSASPLEDGTDPPPACVPIAGIGASAGGLRAFETFVSALPSTLEMAFVLVQHLSPDHESELAQLLQNHTRMNVSQVEDGMAVEANRLYVIPPGKTLKIQDGALHLSEAVAKQGYKAPIDQFFRSLAEDQGDQAVAVVLTGTGSDGSLGVKAIKEQNGLCMAQDPTEADYDGMPRSAIATGTVDVVAPVHELAEKLIAYQRDAERVQLPDTPESLPRDDSDALKQIFGDLNEQTGHDFSDYKRATILRRLERRMQVNRVESLSDYARFLKDNPDESNALFRDFLISVTNFFRDPEPFENLAETVIPTLFDEKGPADTVRVWVPGCATGEEAFSIAMLLHEHAGTLDAPPDVQVFATDLDPDALAAARRGVYSKAIVTDVSSERLERFFERRDDGFRVSQQLMDTVLFAEHNLMKDPPFSRLDLISCRNVLIYIQRDTQETIFEVFHYALRDGGHLFLGSSESPDSVASLFEGLPDTKCLYVRRPGRKRKPRFFTDRSINIEMSAADRGAAENARRKQETALDTAHRDIVVAEHGPASVLVDPAYEITHVLGDVDRFLRLGEGQPTLNLLHLVERSLRLELRPALFRAFDKGEATRKRLSKATHPPLRFTVVPADHPHLDGAQALVSFEAASSSAGDAVEVNRDEDDQHIIEHLEKELSRTRERLRTVTEEYETTNEELKASNEELQSMNEELRSTAEELETSKEELQSTNEELITVNNELKAKVKEVHRANADLKNLLASTEIGTLFLDRDLHLKRYTPRITDVFNVIPGDIGRPLQHLSHEFDDLDLAAEARSVLDSLTEVERELEANGMYFLMRMMPYRAEEERVKGVVATFIDITERRKAELAVRRQVQQQEAVATLGLTATKTLDLDDLKHKAVQTVADTLGVPYVSVARYRPSEDALVLEVSIGIDGVAEGTDDAPKRRSATHDFPSGYALHVREPVVTTRLSGDQRFQTPPHLPENEVQSCLSVPILNNDTPYGVLNVYTTEEDEFTDNDVHFLQSVSNLLASAVNRHNAEEALRRAKEEAEAAAEAKSAFVANISHDLRTPLMAMLGAGEILSTIVDGKGEDAVELIQSSGTQLREMLDSVLSFIESDETSVQLHMRPTNITEEIDTMRSAFRLQAEEDGLDFHLDVEEDLWASIDVTALRRILSNLIDNAVKYTEEGHVSVQAAREDDEVVIVVEDTGIGMSASFQRRAFNAFEQETMGETRTHEGSGLGLSIVKEMVRGMDGTVHLESEEGDGTRFLLRFGWLGPDERDPDDNDVEAKSIVTHVDRRSGNPSDDAEAAYSALESGTPFGTTPFVFIVEDNADTRRVMEMMLESGCRLSMSTAYDEALASARRIASDERTPDVLLLDIHLGESRTGVDLLHALRSDVEAFADIPAVACTAFARTSDRERYLREGFDAYLSKPFGMNDLLSVMTKAIGTATDAGTHANPGSDPDAASDANAS